MVQHILHIALWVMPLVLLAVIATVMVVRGLHKQLPYFFSYTTFALLSNIALLLIHRYPQIYFDSYWLQELISWGLGLAVIYEIYASLLKEYAVLQKLGALLFWIMGAVLVSIALWTAFKAPDSDVSRVLQTLLTLERSVRIVECGLLVALFLFASFFGLSWKNYLFGIALGFAIFLCMQLASVAVRAYTGESMTELFNWLQPLAYSLGVLVWTVYVVKAWQVVDLPTLPKNDLARWNDALKDLFRQ